MTEFSFPEEVTKDNIELLTERAESIKERAAKTRYILADVFVIGVTLLEICVLITAFLSIQQFIPPNLPFLYEIILSIILLGLLVFCIVFPIRLYGFWFSIALWIVQKKFNHPTIEEVIFSECFLIADLARKNWAKTKERGRNFFRFLENFCGYIFNPKRKAYEPEFNLLRIYTKLFYRMVLFSDEAPRLLRDFGLAIVRDDNPKAFSTITEILKKAEEYGEVKGRFSSILSRLEAYSQSLRFILTAIIFIISICLFLVGYRLPF